MLIYLDSKNVANISVISIEYKRVFVSQFDSVRFELRPKRIKFYTEMSHNHHLIIFFILSIAHGVFSATKVQFFEHANFQGITFTVYMSGPCINVPDYFNDLTSSINTGGACIMLYDGSNCSGRRITVAPGTGCHNWLDGCGLNFNDKTSSASFCTE